MKVCGPRNQEQRPEASGVKITTVGYAVIYARTRTGYSAHVPDLPGCIATGRTLPLVKRRMREAIALHIQGMREDGERVPRPTVVVEQIDVGSAA